MINNVVLVGRITKDIEVRQTMSGNSCVSFTLAVKRIGKDEETDFINCVAWNKTAEFMEQYVKKGYLLGVSGRIQTRSYDNQQGQKVYVTEVICNSVQNLTPKQEHQEQQQPTQQQTTFNQTQQQQASYNPYRQQAFYPSFDVNEDELPF